MKSKNDNAFIHSIKESNKLGHKENGNLDMKLIATLKTQ